MNTFISDSPALCICYCVNDTTNNNVSVLSKRFLSEEELVTDNDILFFNGDKLSHDFSKAKLYVDINDVRFPLGEFTEKCFVRSIFGMFVFT